MSKVWACGLPERVKSVALCLADFANDDGHHIYPSMDYIAWKVGCSQRAARSSVSDLRKLCVLVVVQNGTGGRGRSTHYRMHADKLPERMPWVVARLDLQNKSEDPAGFKLKKPGRRMTKTRQENDSNPSDPSCTDPLVEPSGNVRSLRDQVPEPGKVFLKAHHPPKRVKVDLRHAKHVFCGESQCVDQQKHERFLLRIKVAGADLDEAGLQRFYKSVDTDYVKGAFGETPDHPALILEREFQEEIKD